MNIHTAMIYAKQGVAIRRAGWGVPSAFLRLGKDQILLQSDDVTGQIIVAVIDIEDLCGDDWELFTPTHAAFL